MIRYLLQIFCVSMICLQASGAQVVMTGQADTKYSAEFLARHKIGEYVSLIKVEILNTVCGEEVMPLFIWNKLIALFDEMIVNQQFKEKNHQLSDENYKKFHQQLVLALINAYHDTVGRPEDIIDSSKSMKNMQYLTAMRTLARVLIDIHQEYQTSYNTKHDNAQNHKKLRDIAAQKVHNIANKKYEHKQEQEKKILRDEQREKDNKLSAWDKKKQDVFIQALIAACCKKEIDPRLYEQFKASLNGKQTTILLTLARNVTSGDDCSTQYIYELLHQGQISALFKNFGKQIKDSLDEQPLTCQMYILLQTIQNAILDGGSYEKLILDIAGRYSLVIINTYSYVPNDNNLHYRPANEINLIPQVCGIINNHIEILYKKYAWWYGYIPFASRIFAFMQSRWKNQCLKNIISEVKVLCKKLGITFTVDFCNIEWYFHQIYDKKELSLFLNKKLYRILHRNPSENQKIVQDTIQKSAIGAIAVAAGLYKWKHVDPHTRQKIFAQLHFVKKQAFKKWQAIKAAVLAFLGKQQKPVVQVKTGWL